MCGLIQVKWRDSRFAYGSDIFGGPASIWITTIWEFWVKKIFSVLVESVICPRTHVTEYVDGAYGPLHDLPLSVPPSNTAANLH